MMKKILTVIISMALPLGGFAQENEHLNLVRKNNDLAFKLYTELSARSANSNIAFSPFSIYMTLAALYASSSSATAAEIGKFVGFLPSQEAHEKQFSTFGLEFKKNSPFAPTKLDSHNLFWIEDDIFLSPDFRGSLKTNYGIVGVSVDFEKSKQAVSTMNAMMSKASKNQIKDSVTLAHATDSTVFIVQNANYFKGFLELGFGSSYTEKDEFSTPTGKVNIPMMHSETVEYNFVQTSGFTAVKMPYRGGEMSLIVIFPDKGNTPHNALSNLNHQKFVQMMKHLNSSECMGGTLSIPRFKVDIPSVKMDAILKGMGMKSAFSEAADFGKISPKMKNVPLNSYLHKATFILEENGTKAADSKIKTGLFGIALRHNHVNRSFAFLVVENKTNAILMMGNVLDPSKS